MVKDLNQNKAEETKEAPVTTNFSKLNALNDEKRFIVNKDLFTNPYVNSIKNPFITQTTSSQTIS